MAGDPFSAPMQPADEQTGTPPPRRVPAWLWAARVLGTVILAVLIARGLFAVKTVLDRAPAPAGFVRGAFDGAAMPMMMPYLVFAGDAPIYAENNTGRGYKLGYTLGVNACGAVFFGLLYRRVRRLRRAAGQR